MLADRYGLELGTSSSKARDAYVRAGDALLSADVGAEAQFERALAIDPAFAVAMAGLARAHFIVARVTVDR